MDWEQKFKEDYAPWERGSLHPAVSDWGAQGVFKAGLQILVPGCGRSPEVAHFARLGLNVTALDLSATAIAWQREQLAKQGLSATLVEGDGLQWQGSGSLDLFYEQTFLCAISPKLRQTYEKRAHDWLKPDGRLLALFMQKDELGGPPYGCSLDAMQSLFTADRWAWPGDENFTPYPHPSLNGKPELGGILVRR